ncbi:helix-turn-helix domain-containing protein [candidate division KSB1 bacterium]
MKKQISRRAFTIKEATDYACVSRGTIENWLANRLLPYEKLPGRGKGTKRFVRIRKSDLDSFLDAQIQQSCQSNTKTSPENIILLPKCSEVLNET